jgi:hypothetical protein
MAAHGFACGTSGAHAGGTVMTQLASLDAMAEALPHSRRELAGLTHFELKDLGHPAGSAEEKSKPFWRA